MVLKRIGTVLVAIGLILPLAPAAMAEQSYLSLHGGYTVTDNPDLYTFLGDIPHELQGGFAAGGALGIKMDEGLRLEVEMTYRVNSVSSIAALPAGGRVSAISAMFNIIEEFDLFVGAGDNYSKWGFSPYIGIGGGGARLAFEDVTVSGAPFGDDSDYVPAYQGIAGMVFDVGSQGLKMSIDYRYLTIIDGDFAGLSGPAFDAGYRHHSILIGVRTAL